MTNAPTDSPHPYPTPLLPHTAPPPRSSSEPSAHPHELDGPPPMPGFSYPQSDIARSRGVESDKGLWRGAGERFFLGSGQSQLLKQITTMAFIFRPQWLPHTAIFGLFRPSTRVSRGHAPPHGQTPSGPHTAAHRLAPPSALQHGPRPMDATALQEPTAWRRGRFILTRHGRARLPCESA